MSIDKKRQVRRRKSGQVTSDQRDLYKKYPDLEDIAKADIKEFEKDIFSTGFYHNKAKNIIACANVLLEEYDGVVP